MVVCYGMLIHNNNVSVVVSNSIYAIRLLYLVYILIEIHIQVFENIIPLTTNIVIDTVWLKQMSYISLYKQYELNSVIIIAANVNVNNTHGIIFLIDINTILFIHQFLRSFYTFSYIFFSINVGKF